MILDDILENFNNYSNEIACVHDKQYTYGELYNLVCKIYSLIKDASKDKPIVVYGHKEVYIIASFLACSFLGIAYVPIDNMLDDERVRYIVHTVNPSFIIGDLKIEGYNTISFKDIRHTSKLETITKIEMKPDDTYYIIFTSGTTGTPKGVMVSYDNLDSCVNWLKKVSGIQDHIDNYTIYNQAIFSFDLSVADIYLSLATGSNHFVSDDYSLMNIKDFYNKLKISNSNLMILTPSYAELLCVDSCFNQSLMPYLKQIIFCGELLNKKLVDELYFRFPNIKIINMYGPTECTYAVTSIEISKKCSALIPIGYVKDDVNIYIVDNMTDVPDGEVGELLITGKSVSKGYINEPNNNSFINYKGEKGYLTGDLGYYDNGILYYKGRKDSQIKFKGYRIELLDIENNILKIDGVENVKVKVEKDDEVVKRIVAFVVVKDKSKEDYIKNKIREVLPHYMIPLIRFVDTIQLTLNGKIDI